MSRVDLIVLIIMTIALAWYQLVSWILLGGSIGVAVLGFYLFYHHGKPADGMEEREMISRFGEVYEEYMTRTRMFIPCLF
jgi:protein-S-isoprenylcysteine O-methyltransferase Ste14